ncbi:MAG TPA: AraC family transcriptional regulator [Chloroflexota bacterium]|jgi:AraC family transcriptional regulator|nr:AraC family transcriptional regulator [Chloroflexota bacterium]
MRDVDGNLSRIDQAELRAGAQAGIVTYAPRSAFGPRVMRSYQLLTLHSGALRLVVDGQATQVGVGQVALLRPGQRVAFQLTGDGESRQSWLAVQEIERRWQAQVAAGLLPSVLPLSPAMGRLLEAAVALGGGGGSSTTHSCLEPLAIAAVLLYTEEARERGAGAEAGREHPALLAVRQAIAQRLHERLGLADLAEAAQVTPEHLVRLFQRHYGMTPVRFLWEQRVRLGLHLLEHTGLTVTEIATRAGFQTSEHFARQVRKMVGVPPREFRRRAWSAGGSDLPPPR